MLVYTPTKRCFATRGSRAHLHASPSEYGKSLKSSDEQIVTSLRKSVMVAPGKIATSCFVAMNCSVVDVVASGKKKCCKVLLKVG